MLWCKTGIRATVVTISNRDRYCSNPANCGTARKRDTTGQMRDTKGQHGGGGGIGMTELGGERAAAIGHAQEGLGLR